MSTRISAAQRDKGRQAWIEKILEDNGVEWIYQTAVSTHRFDKDRSQHNQGRTEAIVPEKVEEYQEGVKRGDIFPAVVAYPATKAAKPQLVVVDGNHRLEAFDAEDEPLDVYILDYTTKPQMKVLLTHLLNTRHGMPTTTDERCAAAVSFIEGGGTVGEASRLLNVPENAVKIAVGNAKAADRAYAAKVDEKRFNTIPAEARRRLANIGPMQVFKPAAELSAAAVYTAREVNELVKMINSTDDVDKQIKIIDAQKRRDRPRIQENSGGITPVNGKKGRPQTVKQRLGSAFGLVMALDDADVLARKVPEGERTDYASEARSAIEVLEKLAVALDPNVT